MSLNGKRVFLSGPMTGYLHYNVAEFATAHAIVKAQGAAAVYDPAQQWLNERAEIAKHRTHADYMLDCIHELTRRDYRGKPYYDMLVSIGDWCMRDGATQERQVAVSCGIECCSFGDIASSDPVHDGGAS